jgi:hypothetical protein
MNDDTNLMWQHLQARLDHRFGKYFKNDEQQNKLDTHEEKLPEDRNTYKIKFSVSYLNVHNDD